MEPKSSNTDDRELRISRLFEAPIDLVWEVWTNPDHIKNWWGPNGFTNTIHKMDVRPGGEWDLTMHGPDGTDYPNKSIFKEVVKHERIAYEHISAPRFLATIVFTANGNTTQIDWHMLFESKEQFEQVVKTFKADEGLKQNLEKLEVYIEKDAPVVIERTYKAPIDTVWDAISNRDKMAEWYFDLAAFRPEVGFEFSFTGGKDGREFLHLCKVTKVIPGKVLAYTWRYDGYSGSSEVTFELFEEGNNTRLKLTHTGIETFPVIPYKDLAKGNFVGGWTYILGTSLKGYLEK
jgi:uncharacterized protein YndB with AHSA1/START domain